MINEWFKWLMARWNDHLPRQARDERNKTNTRMTDWHVAGRQVHADPSNVTMSFWTTPDSANLDPKTVRASLSLSVSLCFFLIFWSGNVSLDVCFVLSLSWQRIRKRRGAAGRRKRLRFIGASVFLSSETEERHRLPRQARYKH
jgi:hypothetical protein